MQEVRADGRTVLLSSHILSEVQATADRVGMIRAGRLVAVNAVDSVRERSVRRVEIQFDDTVTIDDFAGVPNLRHVTVEAGSAGTVLRGDLTGVADSLPRSRCCIRPATRASPAPKPQPSVATRHRSSKR